MNTINIIELIIIPAIASPLPSLPFLLQFTSPIIEKINPGVDVEPQHKNETIDKMNIVSSKKSTTIGRQIKQNLEEKIDYLNKNNKELNNELVKANTENKVLKEQIEELKKDNDKYKKYHDISASKEKEQMSILEDKVLFISWTFFFKSFTSSFACFAPLPFFSMSIKMLDLLSKVISDSGVKIDNSLLNYTTSGSRFDV